VSIQSLVDTITTEIEKLNISNVNNSNIVIVIDSIAPLLFANNHELDESVLCSNIARALYQIVNCKSDGK
jgi:hypothetical protein